MESIFSDRTPNVICGNLQVCQTNSIPKGTILAIEFPSTVYSDLRISHGGVECKKIKSERSYPISEPLGDPIVGYICLGPHLTKHASVTRSVSKSNLGMVFHCINNWQVIVFATRDIAVGENLVVYPGLPPEMKSEIRNKYQSQIEDHRVRWPEIPFLDRVITSNQGYFNSHDKRWFSCFSKNIFRQ